MKKIAVVLFAVMMTFSLAACSGNQAAPSSTSNSSSLTAVDNSSSSSAPVSSSVPESSSVSESAPEENTASSSEADVSSSQPEEVPESSEPETPEKTSGAKVLVAYFSATNTTEGVAQKLAEGLGADIYEIIPETPYTADDLNYSDNGSRSSIEMNDESARPAISGLVEDMSQYDVVLIGYPIWWGEAPRIVSTFVESYDFSGKTLAAFCTSASSGFGRSDSALKEAAGSAAWLDGKRFSGGASADEILAWANGLGIN